MSLAGRVAIVTGGATGIGLGAAESLIRQEAKVAILQPSLGQARRAVETLGGDESVMAVQADVRNPVEVEYAFAEVEKAWGRIDVLVHSAARTGASVFGLLLECEAAHVDDIVDINLKGSLYCAQAAAKRMKPGSAIVLVSSVGAFAAQEGAGVYCATKAAVSALARSMALEWAALGIRVNAIAPGDILTETSEHATEQRRSSDVGSGRFVRTTPLDRRGTTTEIGEAIAFLVSGKSSFITGTTLVADGGWLTY